MANLREKSDDSTGCGNDFESFNPDFATELSNKLEQASPRNDGVSTIDMYEDRLHEMTASYSEISFDSLVYLPDGSIYENTSVGEPPGPYDLECSMKGRNDLRTNIKSEEELQESDTKRPDKLDLQGYHENNSDIGSCLNVLGNLHLEGTVTTEGDMVSFVAEDLETKIKLSSPVTKKGDTPPFPGSRISTPCLYRQALMPQLPSINQNILNDLEMEVRKIATSVDALTENLAGILHSVSALTVECLETYRDAVCKTCDAVDSNIKSMYQLMAKCEELSKSMKPLYKLAEQIKGIKRLLDLFENAVNS